MKKETEDPGALHYFYNREERMAYLPDHVRDRGRKGVFKGNRSLLITLIDVVFLILLVGVFAVITLMTGNTRAVRGYTVTAKASQFDDRVLVSIKIVAKEDREVTERVRIRISYPEGNERIEISDFLPSEKGGEGILRGALSFDKNQSRLNIDFFVNGARGSIKTRIRKE